VPIIDIYPKLARSLSHQTPPPRHTPPKIAIRKGCRVDKAQRYSHISLPNQDCIVALIKHGLHRRLRRIVSENRAS
jgi:hypothetical protein